MWGRRIGLYIYLNRSQQVPLLVVLRCTLGTSSGEALSSWHFLTRSQLVRPQGIYLDLMVMIVCKSEGGLK